jgi:hypothetical protein
MMYRNNARRASTQLIDMADNGAVSWEKLARDLLEWMDESDVAQFADVNDYFTTTEDEGE